jgi:hypothetical protein
VSSLCGNVTLQPAPLPALPDAEADQFESRERAVAEMQFCIRELSGRVAVPLTTILTVRLVWVVAILSSSGTVTVVFLRTLRNPTSTCAEGTRGRCAAAKLRTDGAGATGGLLTWHERGARSRDGPTLVAWRCRRAAGRDRAKTLTSRDAECESS